MCLYCPQSREEEVLQHISLILQQYYNYPSLYPQEEHYLLDRLNSTRFKEFPILPTRESGITIDWIPDHEGWWRDLAIRLKDGSFPMERVPLGTPPTIKGWSDPYKHPAPNSALYYTTTPVPLCQVCKGQPQTRTLPQDQKDPEYKRITDEFIQCVEHHQKYDPCCTMYTKRDGWNLSWSLLRPWQVTSHDDPTQ
jgi:hypothetical protein